MTAPSNANTSGLAPCPFCGGEAWLNDYDAKYSDLPPMSRAPQCRSCGASLGYLTTPAKATEAWNRRAAPASPLPEGGGWQDISTFTESGQGSPVFVAVPTKEGGWIVGEAWKSVMEPDDAYRGNDGWWWAGTSPGDAYNDPIRFMNHGDAEWWMPLPAAPTGGA